MPSRVSRRMLMVLALLALPAPAAAQGPDPIARGVSLYQQKQWTAARRALEPYVQSHPNDARAAYFLGSAMLEEGSTDAALPHLERAVELNGDNADYRLQLGNAYGLKARDANVLRQAVLARKAKGEFDRAVELSPNNVEARWGLMRFFMMAPGILGGDMNKAREQAQAIKRLNPYRGVEAMAVVMREQGNTAGVIAEYEAAIRAYPDSIEYYHSLGFAYDAQKNYPAQWRVYEQLLRRRPEYMGVYFQLGRLAAVSGQQLERGEQMLKRYLQHTPNRVTEPPHHFTHYRLGNIYEKQGKRDEARAQYQAALRLDPGHRDSRDALARLGS